MAINYKDCLFTFDGTPYQGVEAFHKAILDRDMRISPEQAGVDAARAKEHGYEHPVQALYSVNKRMGTDYQMLSEVPDNALKTASEEREKDLAMAEMEAEKQQRMEGERMIKEAMPEAGSAPKNEPIEKAEQLPVHDDATIRMIQKGVDAATSPDTRQRIESFWDSMKIKGDALYALPVPAPVWNLMMEGAKKLMLAGVDVAEAIRRTVADFKNKGLTQDEADASELEMRERAKLNVEPREKAAQYVADGRSDAQIMSYLKAQGLSHGVALAIMGDAKANPIPKETRFKELKAAEKDYFKNEGKWLGRKAVARFLSEQNARKLQDKIKGTIPKGKGRQAKANDVDKAIHIYLDLQRNPGHLKQFYDQLTPEQQKIVDLSQNLTPEQKKIAEDIRAGYDQLALMARGNDIIKTVLDNYVARAWSFEDKAATEQFSKFKVGTRHNIERTLDTILEGWSKGYKLAIEGSTNNLQALAVELNNAYENKKFIERGMQVKYDTGELDDEGKPIFQPLFTTSAEDGYKKIENPYFKKWTYSGKLEDYEADEANTFGKRKDVLVGEDGTVMKKEDVYAPERVAKSLNNILGRSVLLDVPGINALTKFGKEVKFSILSLSGFHYVAFSRAHFLTGQKGGWPHVNPVTAYKAGLDAIANQNEHLIRLIENGLTLTRKQDFDEAVSNHTTWLGKQMDKLSFTKYAKDSIIGLTEMMHKHLFETFGAGLKSFDGINLLQKELKDHPGADPDEAAARVAKILNDTYGGINWERMHGTAMQNPTVRHLSSLLLLAPDWTASNLRFAKKAFERGDEGDLYRKAWARVLLRGTVLTGMANAGLAFMDEKDGENWESAFTRRYKEAWEQGGLRSTMIDITPLYRFAGGQPDKVAYFSIFGAYTDPLKVVSNPIQFLENKLAFLPKAGLEALTSQNWQKKEFTTVDELFGMDDKGTYSRAYTNKKTGKSYLPGEEKGGKLAGELVKYPKGGAHALTPYQFPSFFLSQIRGMTPIGVQNLWQAASGENDWTYTIMNGIGTGVVVSKKKLKE